MLSQALARSLEKILQADPDVLLLAEPLQGAKLGLVFPEWGLELTFIPSQEKFSILPLLETPDILITGKIVDFLTLMRDSSATPAKTGILIQGNIRLLPSYQTFFKRWNFDLGHVISKTLGQAAALRLSTPLEKIFQKFQSCFHELKLDLKESVQEEQRLLVPHAELEDFYQELRMLQLRVDRLQDRCMIQESYKR